MFSRYLSIVAGFLLSLNAGVAFAQDVASQEFDHLFGVTTTPATHAGRSAVRIELSNEEQAAQLAGAGGNRPTFAVLDVPFANGVIEVDIAVEINGRGGKDARGFAGIAFHMTEDGEAFEAVYLRMSNGTANVPPPPSPRDVRAIQYIAHPGFHFVESRAERPAHYEKAANVALGRWHRLRLEIDGSNLTAFVDGTRVLAIDDLRRANYLGPIGLWVGDGTRAHFANLTISGPAATIDDDFDWKRCAGEVMPASARALVAAHQSLIDGNGFTPDHHDVTEKLQLACGYEIRRRSGKEPGHFRPRVLYRYLRRHVGELVGDDQIEPSFVLFQMIDPRTSSPTFMGHRTYVYMDNVLVNVVDHASTTCWVGRDLKINEFAGYEVEHLQQMWPEQSIDAIFNGGATLTGSERAQIFPHPVCEQKTRARRGGGN